MPSIYVSILPLFIAFGIPLWIIVYLQTYRHFPKMEPSRRVWSSITNATLVAGSVILITYLAWILLERSL